MKKIVLLLIVVMLISFVLPNLFLINEISFATLGNLNSGNIIETASLGINKFIYNFKNIFSKDTKKMNLNIGDNNINSGDIKAENANNSGDTDKNSESGDVSVTIKEVEKIKLLLNENNEIVELPFDEYIKGVLVGEMPASYEIEALKAQAIVARTYTLYKMNGNLPAHNGADICDDINCCQCYRTKEYAFMSWDDAEENEKWNKIENAVISTKGKCITYNGSIIPAYFHANSGGKTENVEDVWGGNSVPYLVSVSGNEKDLYIDSKEFTYEEIRDKLKSKVPNYESGEKIEIVDYTASGRVKNIKIGSKTIKATELRSLLELRSTNFKIEYLGNGKIKFNTIGYGHGVGMSQYGANQMALEGKNCEEIIKHYYTGACLSV